MHPEKKRRLTRQRHTSVQNMRDMVFDPDVEMLPKDKQEELFQKYQDGCEESGKTLIWCNMPYAIDYANKFRNDKGDLPPDIVQEAFAGLCKALNRYNPDKGSCFTSYARWWIRASIIEYMNKNQDIVKIGGRYERKFKIKWCIMLEDLGKTKEEVTIRDMRDYFGVTEKDISNEKLQKFLNFMSASYYSTNAHIGDDSNKNLLVERLFPESLSTCTKDETELNNLRELLREFSDQLDPRERTIYFLRIIAENPASLREIGDEHGITKERVRQIECRAIRKFIGYLEFMYGKKLPKVREIVNGRKLSN